MRNGRSYAHWRADTQQLRVFGNDRLIHTFVRVLSLVHAMAHLMKIGAYDFSELGNGSEWEGNADRCLPAFVMHTIRFKLPEQLIEAAS